MAEELAFKDAAAAEYDRAFAHVTAHFMPFLLRAAHIAPGMHVLDIATGTGLSPEAALAAVGPTGHVTAADISPAMTEKARQRLDQAPNASVSVEDGQALSFSDGSFDAVLCNLGLMFFPDPVRGLSEFRRVLRPGGRVAVSVNTVVERSYNHQINAIIARHVPSLTEAVTRTFALGEASRLRSLFSGAGFGDIETNTVRRTFVLPSFDAYYGHFERGGASTGQALAACLRRYATPCVRRCGATSPTRVGLSRPRQSTGSPAPGASKGVPTGTTTEIGGKRLQRIGSIGSDLVAPRRGREGLQSARLARCRVSQRRSLDRTDSSHSTVRAATALPAPYLPFVVPVEIGSVGGKLSFVSLPLILESEKCRRFNRHPRLGDSASRKSHSN